MLLQTLSSFFSKKSKSNLTDSHSVMETQRTNASSGTNNKNIPEQDDPLFEQLKREAAEVVRREPILTPLLTHIGLLTPTPSTSFNEVISRILTHRLVTSCGSQSSICPIYLQTTLLQCMESSELELGHTMSHAVREDALCVWRRDPACETLLEVVLFMKGWASLVLHRAARRAWKPDDVVDGGDGDATIIKNDAVDNHHDTLPTSTIRGTRFVSLYLQFICSTTFGVDIHPAAQIGAGVMIDHATGVVIGETATVGDNTTILHGVTLGGTGKESGDRHPKIGKDVLIGANTQILGNITIGDRAKIGAGSVVLRPIPSGATAVGSPAKIIGFTPRGERPGSMVDVRLAGVEPLVGHGEKKKTTMSGGSPLVKSVVSSKKEGLRLSTVSEEGNSSSMRESLSEGDTETTTTSTTSANISTGSLGLGIEDDDDDADSTTGDSEDDNITDFGTPAKLHYIKTSHNDTMCPFRNTFCQGTNGKDMISHKKLRSLLLQEGCTEGETVEVFFELLHLVPEDSDARQSGCIPLPIFGRYFPEIAMEKTKLDKETCDAIARGDLRTLGMSKRASRKFKSMFEILGTIPLEEKEEQDLNLANEKYQRTASKEEEKVEKQYSLLDTTGYAEEIAI